MFNYKCAVERTSDTKLKRIDLQNNEEVILPFCNYTKKKEQPAISLRTYTQLIRSSGYVLYGVPSVLLLLLNLIVFLHKF